MGQVNDQVPFTKSEIDAYCDKKVVNFWEELYTDLGKPIPDSIYDKKSEWVHTTVSENGFPKCELVNPPEIKGLPEVPKAYSLPYDKPGFWETMMTAFD